MELPESALPRCVVGDHPTERLKLYEITGFEEERSQGGTNHVIGRKRIPGRGVCPEHAYTFKRGLDGGQGSLL